MELLVDHTSLHAVGRCLTKKAVGEPDLAGLLQFATQLVFADAIILSNIDSGGVINASRDIASILNSEGVGTNILILTRLSKKSFCLASTQAADKLAEDLQYVFPNNELVPEGLFSVAKPNLNKKLMQHENKFYETILAGEESARRELLDESLNNDYIGSAAYMVTNSDSLWSAVRSFVEKGNWNQVENDRLNVFLRYYLNTQLAELVTTVRGTYTEYSPSVARARITNNINTYMIYKLSEVVGNAAKQLEPVLLGAPSVAGALVLRSKGDPRALLTEALEAREKAVELRKALSQKMRYEITKEGFKKRDIHEIRKIITTLSNTLRQDLGIVEKPKLSDALEMQFIGLVPIPNVKKLINWFTFKKSQKSISVLSEFAKTLVDYQTYDQLALNKLKNNVYRKTDHFDNCIDLYCQKP